MTISFIVAMSENNAIGRGNELPWHLPADMQFFKRTTMGKPVLMGRKTYESLGKPLPGRLNIVVSRDKNFAVPDGVLICDNINDAVERLEAEAVEEGFIIGGGKIFEETMSQAERMYITRVHADISDADTFFPAIDHTHWKLAWEEKHTADEKHAYAYTFQQYDRIEI